MFWLGRMIFFWHISPGQPHASSQKVPVHQKLAPCAACSETRRCSGQKSHRPRAGPRSCPAAYLPRFFFPILADFGCCLAAGMGKKGLEARMWVLRGEDAAQGQNPRQSHQEAGTGAQLWDGGSEQCLWPIKKGESGF